MRRTRTPLLTNIVCLLRPARRSGVPFIALLLASLVGSIAPASARQGGTTTYGYDANGRLHVVVSPTGDATIYDYDPAGNITAIRRPTGSALAIYALLPTQGSIGDRLTIVGTGFGAGVTSVTFSGGASANVVSSSAATVVVDVPAGAATGPVTVATAGGSATSADAFTLIAGVRVVPSAVALSPGETAQFTALTTLLASPDVHWTVNGVASGNATVGTITAAGLYTAPSHPFTPITVEATSVSDATLSGEADVTIHDPNSVISTFSEPVSVAFGAPTSRPRTISPGVLVLVGTQASLATVTAPPVSARLGPNVASVNPATLAPGTGTAVTLTGVNLTGLSAIWFVNPDGTLDTSITASNLSVDANGTSATATLTVDAASAPGRRILVVTTASGSSPLGDTGTNAVTVTGP